MIFLIEYDRPSGKLINIREYEGASRVKANKDRLELELDLLEKSVVHEVVLLEAKDEAALRITHRRYFESLAELGESLLRALAPANRTY